MTCLALQGVPVRGDWILFLCTCMHTYKLTCLVVGVVPLLEKFIVKDFQKAFPNSIKNAAVGFMSPDPKAMENPSYKQVCKRIVTTTEHTQVSLMFVSQPIVLMNHHRFARAKRVTSKSCGWNSTIRKPTLSLWFASFSNSMTQLPRTDRYERGLPPNNNVFTFLHCRPRNFSLSPIILLFDNLTG